jgi:hypothetical protein
MAKQGKSENVAILPTGEAVYTPPAETAPAANGEGKPAKPVESKRAKFLRLANRRLPAALKRIEQLTALGNRGQYDFEEKHSTAIIDALDKAIVSLKRRYSGERASAPAPLLS